MPHSSPLWLRVDGAPLESIVAYGAVSFETEWGPDGCGLHEVKWEAATDHRFRHPAFRGGALVELFDAGLRIGQALMREPDVSTGQFSAEGLYRQAESFVALDGSGNATSKPDTAIDQAAAAGSRLSRGGVSISSASFTATETGVNTVASLLSACVEEQSETTQKRWAVDADGIVSIVSDPTTPTLHLAPDLFDLGATQTGYASTVVGRFDLGSGFVTRKLTDTDARDTFGAVQVPEDFTSLGVVTPTKADKILAAYLRQRSRPSFTNPIEVTADHLTSAGGTPVDLSTVRAGQMVRAEGFYDDIRVLDGRTWLDWIIGRTSYSDSADSITLTPLGMEQSSLVRLLAGLGSNRKRFAA